MSKRASEANDAEDILYEVVGAGLDSIERSVLWWSCLRHFSADYSIKA